MFFSPNSLHKISSITAIRCDESEYIVIDPIRNISSFSQVRMMLAVALSNVALCLNLLVGIFIMKVLNFANASFCISTDDYMVVVILLCVNYTMFIDILNHSYSLGLNPTWSLYMIHYI